MAALATVLILLAIFVWFLTRHVEPKPVCWTVERVTDAHLWEPLFLTENYNFGKWSHHGRTVIPHVEFKTAEEGAVFMKKYNLKECAR